MAAKQLVFSEDARRRLQQGIDVVADAVGTTLGPKGRNVAIDRKFGSPTITHDGVTVAKEIELEDPFENMGAAMVSMEYGFRGPSSTVTTACVTASPR